MRRSDHFPDLDSERAPRTRHSGAASAESTAPLYPAGRMVKNKKTGTIKTASTKRRRKVFTANDEGGFRPPWFVGAAEGEGGGCHASAIAITHMWAHRARENSSRLVVLR